MAKMLLLSSFCVGFGKWNFSEQINMAAMADANKITGQVLARNIEDHGTELALVHDATSNSETQFVDGTSRNFTL